MTVFRVNKTENFTTISNTHLRDKTISLKAKGLLTVILSLPENWNYSVVGLSSILKEGRDGISSAVKELETNGYIQRTQSKNAATGRFSVIYDVYEIPVTALPLRQHRNGFTVTVNPTGINTNDQLTKNKEHNSASDDAPDEKSVASESQKIPPCPYEEIVKLYHEILPECPMCRELNDLRKRQLRNIWKKEKWHNLDQWRKYFEHIKESDFLTGRIVSPGHNPKIFNLEWFTKPNNFTKVREGIYHR